MRFIRTLWGDKDRWEKVKGDIEFQINHSIKQPEFTCLTYGLENHKMLLSKGIDSQLIHKDAYLFDRKQFWAHKIYSWVKAAESHDRFIYLDWDVELVEESDIVNKLDEYLEKKRLLVSLRLYMNVNCSWRSNKRGKRALPCASWIYFGDNNIPQELYNLWEEMGKPRREERVLAKYTEFDDVFNGKYYWRNYEPYDFEGGFSYFHLRNKAFFKRKFKGAKCHKKSIFRHVARHEYRPIEEKS